MSEQQKHTPGPWAAFSDESGAGHTNIVAVVPRTTAIASFTGKHKSDPDICLIAAAPELLEAAIWCKALCEETGATATNAYAAACAAIAKAEGRT